MLLLPIWRCPCFFSYRRFTSGLKCRSLEVEPGPYSLRPETQLETELRLFLCKLKSYKSRNQYKQFCTKKKRCCTIVLYLKKWRLKVGHISKSAQGNGLFTPTPLHPLLFPETVSLCCLGRSHSGGDSPAKASKRWHDRYVPLHPVARPFPAKMAEQVYTQAASPLSQQWPQGACDPMAHAHLINGILLTIVIYLLIYLNIYWFSRQSFFV